MEIESFIFIIGSLSLNFIYLVFLAEKQFEFDCIGGIFRVSSSNRW